MEVSVTTVNAFTASGGGGNPAGVVLSASNLQSQQMLLIAQILGLSETAFVCSSAVATKKLRFFTPTEELDLCGHATIATWSLLKQRDLIKAGEYTQETLAGVLTITVAPNNLIFMEQAAPQIFETVEVSRLAQALGLDDHDVSPELDAQVVSTGLRDIMVPVRDKNVLLKIQPNFDLITTLCEEHNATGLHVFCLLSDSDSVAAARNFSPLVGIPEEAATGTATGALLYYLRAHERLLGDSANQVFQFEQGESMNSLSYIYARFEENRIFIGGASSIGETQIIEITS